MPNLDWACHSRTYQPIEIARAFQSFEMTSSMQEPQPASARCEPPALGSIERDARTRDRLLVESSIILAFIAWATARSMSAAIDLPTNHLDGAFQTASALFRLHAGQYPGRDFLPYLGIGPTLILFPAFQLFGANLGASVAAAQWITLLLGGLAPSILWHLILRPRSFLSSFAGGCFFFFASLEGARLLSEPLRDLLTFPAMPGNSLRPIRASAPYLAAAAYYFGVQSLSFPRQRSIATGLLTGALLLWSNDFAIPSSIGLAGLALFTIWFSSSARLTDISAFLLSATAGAALLLTLTTLGHPFTLIKYNLLDVATDQWWYFAPYQPSARVFQLSGLLTALSIEGIELALGLLAIAVVALFITHRPELLMLVLIGVMQFFGGLLPSVGGHVGGYFGAFRYWGFSTLVFFVAATGHFLLTSRVRDTQILALIHRTGALIALLLSLGIAVLEWNKHSYDLRAAQDDPHRHYVPELGGFLPISWRDYLSLARNSREQSTIEEYWGIWSALRRSFPSWSVDSVIHALGSTREAALRGLKEADLIISTRYEGSPEWQPWSLSQNFWFYGELLRHWTPSALSPTTVVWRKDSQPREEVARQCRLDTHSPAILLEAAKPGFFAVRLDYSLRHEGRALLMIRNGISYSADAGGYVSVNPDGSTAEIPIFIPQSGPFTLDIKIASSGDHHLDVHSCLIRPLEQCWPEVLHPPATAAEAFYLTDANWVRGVARRWAGFFLPNSPDFRDKYRAGLQVALPNGEPRRIIRVEPAGGYLNVYLEGDPLDPQEMGLPSELRVIQEAVR